MGSVIGRLQLFASCFFLSSADFFQNRLFRIVLSGIPSECQIVWIQIRPDILSGLIWVQTVYKSYQQTTQGDRVKEIEILAIILVPLIMTLSRGHTGQIKAQS